MSLSTPGASRFFARTAAMGEGSPYSRYGVMWLRNREVDGRSGSGRGAVERERQQRVRLEVAHEESDREVRRHGRTERADEGGPADAVALRAGEVRELERRGGADDRRCEQEREPGRVLVREADEEAAAHGRAGTGEARDERDRLRRPDERRVAPADRPRDARVVVRVRDRSAAAEDLGTEQDEAVAREEDGCVLRRAEERAELVLQRDSEDARRNRADDEQPTELRVGVTGRDLPVAQRAPEALEDADPVAPEEAQEDERRRQMGGDEERQEVVRVLLDVPADELREDDAVTEAGDGEQLRHALKQAERGPLEVGDRHRSLRRARALRSGVEPREREAGKADEERRDAVLRVVVARARLVAREERRQRLRRLDPVDDRDDDERDAEDDGK